LFASRDEARCERLKSLELEVKGVNETYVISKMKI